LEDQNNFIGTLKITSDAAKNFDILTISSSVNIIILMVEQNYLWNYRKEQFCWSI